MHQNQRRPTTVRRHRLKIMQPVPTRLDILTLDTFAPQMKSKLLIRHP